MATNLQVIHNWGTIPDGYEPSDPNDFVQKLASILTSYVAGTYSLFNFGSSTPAAEDQDKPWVKTDDDGVIERIYTYSNGQWVSPHNIPASDGRRWIYVGTEASVDTLDGGEAGAATTTTGPFWEIDTTFEAKFPVGVGTFTNAGEVAVNGTSTDTSVSGEDEHTLTVAEGGMAGTHTHTVGRMSTNSGSEGDDVWLLVGATDVTDGAARAVAGNTTATTVDVEDATGEWVVTGGVVNGTTAIEPHNNLPPFIGVYFIKRTVRKHFVAA